MQLQDIVAILEDKIKAAGSQAALARQLGVSEQYVSDIRLGKTKPGKKMLDALDIKMVIIYEFKHER